MSIPPVERNGDKPMNSDQIIEFQVFKNIDMLKKLNMFLGIAP